MRHLVMLGTLLATATVAFRPLAAQTGAGAAATTDVIAPESMSLAFSAANGAATARLAPERRVSAESDLNWTAATASGSKSEGTALMIVGAAGIIVGLIVDEPIVTVAGAVTGGIGLYLYLRHGGEIKVDSRRTPATTADWAAAPASER